MKIVVISPHIQNPYPNIGDSYIALGIANLLREHDIKWMPLHQRPNALDIREINRSDMVIIGGSNIIGNLQTFYCSWSANDFAAIEVPIVPLALGAQADAGQKPRIDKRGKIILDIIVQKSRAISVRDQLTKEFLADIYPDIDIQMTGCTAIFLGAISDTRKNEKIVFCAGPVFPYVSIYHNWRYWNMLRKITSKLGVTQILAQQKESILFKHILKYPVYWPQEKHADAIKQIVTAKFLVSGRIHAAIAAVQHGVPSIVIATDERVVSLARTYGIPCFAWSQTKLPQQLLSFYENALMHYDQQEINKNIETLRCKTINFLAIYGINIPKNYFEGKRQEIPNSSDGNKNEYPSLLVSLGIRCIKKYPYFYKKIRFSRMDSK